MRADSRKSSPEVRISLKASPVPTVGVSSPPSFAFAFQIRKATSKAIHRSSPSASPRQSVMQQRMSPREKREETSSTPKSTARKHSEETSRISIENKALSPSPPLSPVAQVRPSSHRASLEIQDQSKEKLLGSLVPQLQLEERKLLMGMEEGREHKRNASVEVEKGEGGKGEASGQMDLSEEKTVRRGFHARATSFSDLSEAKHQSRSSISVNPAREEEERQRLVRLVKEAYHNEGQPPVTTSEWYRYGMMLGRGAFGKVSLAVHRLTGLNVAIKSIEKAYMEDERSSKKVFQEVFAMRRVRHPNVIRLFEVFESSRHFNMVMEYVGGGDLLQLVRTRGKLTEGEAAMIFAQIVGALAACHEKNIVHRDIKLDNILLDSSFTTIKLCDFGVSRAIKPGQKITDQCGTPAYIAPEIIVNRGYEGPPVDVWSLGVLLYAMLTGTVPFRAKTMPDLQKLILKGKFDMPESLSDEAKSLIKGMIKLAPGQRMTLEEVTNHPWVVMEHEEQAEYDSTVPRFMGSAELPLGKGKMGARESEEILRRMESLGFPHQPVLTSLYNREITHATATYDLLETLSLL